MATLDNIANTINLLHGDRTFKSIHRRDLNVLESGRRANHDFIVKTNMRTLRSGPNRGKIRVDGAVVVMFGNRDRSIVNTSVVRDGSKLLSTLDELAESLSYWGQ